MIASASASDALQVRGVLEAVFDGVEMSVIPADAGADFDRVRPDVVVLAFENLDQVRTYEAALLETCGPARAGTHRSVLLCAKEELQEAYELCLSGRHDDYVHYWPLAQDGYRLPMTVWNACTRFLLLRQRETAARVLEAGSSSTAADASAVDAAAKPSKPIVLVVDDDAFASKLIAKALEKQNYRLAFATDVHDAQAMLHRIRPAVILMDILLPGMDGIEFTEWLKASPSLADIPVIMLTGEARRETISRSQAVGAAGFLVKPFSRDVLIAKLAQFVQA